jgi:predicted ATPase
MPVLSSFAMASIDGAGPARSCGPPTAWGDASLPSSKRAKSKRVRGFSRTLSRSWKAAANTWYEAELHRVKGLLLLASSIDAQAEAVACFEHAMAVAHAQGARLFELRAAVALSRQQCDPDQRKRRKALLGSVYGSFIEGFDTPDLKEARALLDALA